LLGGGGELLPEVAGADFDGAKKFALRGVDQRIGQLFEQRGGLRLQVGQEPRAAFGAGLRGNRSRTVGRVVHTWNPEQGGGEGGISNAPSNLPLGSEICTHYPQLHPKVNEGWEIP
jgi:hypothetical protein